jgi:hypothetical protein
VSHPLDARSDRRATLEAGLVWTVALAASLAGLWNGFALDDVILLADDPLLHSLADPLKLLGSAYWRLPPADTLWRPLGMIFFAVQWAAGDGAPIFFHLVNVLAYLAVCRLVLAVARQVAPAGPACVAALIFAAHPVHVESVGNVVGQLELWVAIALLGAVWLYLRDRQRGTLLGTTIAALVVLQAVGLGFKEHAVLLVLFLALCEVSVLRGVPMAGTTRLPGFARVRLTALLLISTSVLWFLFRGDIVGSGFAGDWPHRALQGLDFPQRAWVMLGLVPEFVRLLWWPARLYSDYSPQLIPVMTAPSVSHLTGALWLAVWTAGLAFAWRRSALLVFGLGWIAVALSLIANLAVPTGVLIAERTLFLATVGVAFCVAGLAALAWPTLAAWRREQRRVAGVAFAGLVVLAAAHSSERQGVWKDNGTLMATLLVEAPENFRGHLWLGDSLFRAGEPAAGEAALLRARELWPLHDGAAFLLAVQYQRHRRCEPAMPLFREVIALQPQKPVPRIALAGCLLSHGRFSDARVEAFEGLRHSQHSREALWFIVTRADSLLAHHDSLRSNNRWAQARARRATVGSGATD